MMAQAIQPKISIDLDAVKGPITEGFADNSKITTIKGTAATPLTTALQKSAFMGLIGEY